MDTLHYLSTSQSLDHADSKNFIKVKVNLVTNFTDEVLKRMIEKIGLDKRLIISVNTIPYKQYPFYLKDKASSLWIGPHEVTFIFFDFNQYIYSEFYEERYFIQLFEDIKTLANDSKQLVVINTFVTPYEGAYGNLFEHSPLFKLITQYNENLLQWSRENTNVCLLDTNKLVHNIGSSHIRDFRGLYAFDMPFTNDFFYTVAQEWVSFLSVLKGLVKKCLVLDLDNTLWGGVVGEVGPLGVELGPQYPGLAYQNFQRALLEYYNRGILLTINSRNNEADILEVFEKNPQMILKQNHFAVIKANWNNKAENIVQIAEELNIGLDSLVFIDDDPLNREWVKKNLPQVKVLEFSIPPEEYVATLFAGRLFDQVNLTAEDMQRARMYTQESERKKLQVSKQTLAEYIKELGIVVKVSYNNLDQVARISQLTLKTNQFNVTTTRYTEQDIERCIEDGFVYSADIADTFGPYGITALVIILPDETLQSATIDTFLMSCRVMGRGIEYVLLDYCLRELSKKGFKTVRANFIPTNKNIPAKDFFNTAGFKTVLENQDEVRYELSLAEYVNKPKSQVVYDSIEIKSI